MLKKSVVTLTVLVLVLAGLAWIKRIDLMLALVKYRSEREFVVAPNREIAWDQGPQEELAGAGERPPNIILILADDLGYNDISTFGGGVAGGRMRTPHIDQLAAQGVVDGELTVRPTCFLTMNFDRRVMSGAQAGRFFARVCELLADPGRRERMGRAARRWVEEEFGWEALTRRAAEIFRRAG